MTTDTQAHITYLRSIFVSEEIPAVTARKIADALEDLQAENAQWRVDFKEMVIERNAALARLAITEEANSMLLARNKWLEHTLEVAGTSPVEPSLALVVELVAAANKDAVLQASIDFIRELTGMEPPPIEVAPPETFQPFKTFADKVCAIFATPQAAAQPEPSSRQPTKQASSPHGI